jgi:hypothetical protein
MINPFAEVNWNPGTAARRSFARSLLIGFPVLAVLFLGFGFLRTGTWNLQLPLLIGGIGAAAGLVFLAIPAIAKPFYIAWYAAACSIGFVVSNVLMASVFYVLFTGTGLVVRLLGRRSLETKLDRSAATYWIDAGPPPEPGRYFRQF